MTETKKIPVIERYRGNKYIKCGNNITPLPSMASIGGFRWRCARNLRTWKDYLRGVQR